MTNVITNLPWGPQNIHYIHIYKIQADQKLYINQDVNTICVYIMLEMVHNVVHAEAGWSKPSFVPQIKIYFYIAVISFQPSLLEEEIYNHYRWYK